MAQDRFGIVGKVVARTYRVEAAIAEGGFGVIYRADHKGFRAKVALKCLKIPAELDEELRQKFLEQFRSEAEVLFRLSSQIPNIVRPLHVDAFHTDDKELVPFLALEWLEGRTLDALIASRREAGKPPLPLDRIVRLLAPAAAALDLAHHFPDVDGGTVAVIHRDLKPENIFIARIGEDDVAKVLDFGISKIKSAAGQLAGRASQTGSAFVAFSPAYAAPEQWSPKRFGQTGRWTDVWGLAITIVEAAKGSDVITGDQAEMLGTILDPARRPTPRNEGVRCSDTVEMVFRRALAVDPQDRYQTVSEFWNDLIRALELYGVVAPLPVRTGQSAAGPALGGALAHSAPPPPEQRAGRDSPPPREPAPRRALASTAPLAAASLSPSRLETASVTVRPAATGFRSVAPSQSRPRLGPPISLGTLALSFTLLDRAYAATRGIPLALGPLRASWVAGALMVAALWLGITALTRALGER